MTRISTANAFKTGLTTLQNRQQDLVTLQQQLTTGKRVARASDDPLGAARAERAMASENRAAADQRALSASRTSTLQAESALGAAGEILLKARDLIVSAGNGSYSDAERKTLGEAIRELRTDLLGIVNRGDGSGAYLFGGQGSQQPPFADTPAGVVFNGSSGSQLNAGAEALPLTMDGRAIFLSAPNGVDGAPNLSVFDALDRMATELTTANRTNDQITQGVRDALRDLDASSNHLLAQRANAGETLQRTDSVEVRLSDQALAASVERSSAEDLDMVHAISDFQNQQNGYDAALKAYSMVQRLSLFQYVGS